MGEQMDIVAAIISANGGELVGKTRLQKTVYFLEKCGLGGEFEFEYHNFGPYSAELAREVEYAVNLDQIKSQEKQGFYNNPYTLFISDHVLPAKIGKLSAAKLKNFLKTMSEYSALELEVAATLNYFSDAGIGDKADVEEKVKLHKPRKATESRISRGWELISKLGLALPS